MVALQISFRITWFIPRSDLQEEEVIAYWIPSTKFNFGLSAEFRGEWDNGRRWGGLLWGEIWRFQMTELRAFKMQNFPLQLKANANPKSIPKKMIEILDKNSTIRKLYIPRPFYKKFMAAIFCWNIQFSKK